MGKEKYNNRPDVLVDGEKLPQTTKRQVERRKKSDKKLGALLKNLDIDFDLGSPKLSPKVKASSPKLKPGSPKVSPGSPKATPASPKRKATAEKSAPNKKRKKA